MKTRSVSHRSTRECEDKKWKINDIGKIGPPEWIIKITVTKGIIEDILLK